MFVTTRTIGFKYALRLTRDGEMARNLFVSYVPTNFHFSPNYNTATRVILYARKHFQEFAN